MVMQESSNNELSSITTGKTSSDRWQIGYRIASQYEICGIIGGEGKTGMGVVYICYHHKHRIPYALKTFQKKYFSSEDVNL